MQWDNWQNLRDIVSDEEDEDNEQTPLASAKSLSSLSLSGLRGATNASGFRSLFATPASAKPSDPIGIPAPSPIIEPSAGEALLSTSPGQIETVVEEDVEAEAQLQSNDLSNGGEDEPLLGAKNGSQSERKSTKQSQNGARVPLSSLSTTIDSSLTEEALASVSSCDRHLQMHPCLLHRLPLYFRAKTVSPT